MSCPRFVVRKAWAAARLYALALVGSEHISLSFQNLTQRCQHSNLRSKNDYPNSFFLRSLNLLKTRIAVLPFTVPQKSETDIFGGIIAITWT